ncbi:MAG: hypothetical protein P8P30_03785 [Rickettsiales bacterium]|nr:hypothetical protein [Rickettsiales bacterium]
MKYLTSVLVLLLLPLSAISHESKSHYEENENCREFTKEIRIRGKKEYAFGIACQQYDGSWEIVNDEQFKQHESHHSRKVYVPNYGIHINLGKRYHHDRWNQKSRQYGQKWRGRKWLKYLKKKHKRKWKHKTHGGNSYSHLITKSRKDKK